MRQQDYVVEIVQFWDWLFFDLLYRYFWQILFFLIYRDIWRNLLFFFGNSQFTISEFKVSIKSIWKTTNVNSDSWALANISTYTNHVSYFVFISRCLQLWILLVLIKSSWCLIITVLDIIIRVLFVWIFLISLNWLLETFKWSVCIIFHLACIIDINIT